MQHPFVRQSSLGVMLLQIAIIVAFYFSLEGLGIINAYLISLLVYAGLSTLLKNIFSKHHRKGVRLIRSAKYQEAIGCFEKSVAYFEAHPRLDQFRSILILSASFMTYWEMGLCNIAYCHIQNGQGEDALKMYKKVLEQYPENGLAQAGHKAVQAGARITQTEIQG